ncbi:MAG: hypothetical protein LBS98_05135 [Coriobacteriales bacterium]|nr:hypothetical protein [Coriobacteriales bacterium]
MKNKSGKAAFIVLMPGKARHSNTEVAHPRRRKSSPVAFSGRAATLFTQQVIGYP